MYIGMLGTIAKVHQNVLNIMENNGFERHIRCDNEDWYVNSIIK